jgi:hypothetical protein
MLFDRDDALEDGVFVIAPAVEFLFSSTASGERMSPFSAELPSNFTMGSEYERVGRCTLMLCRRPYMSD